MQAPREELDVGGKALDGVGKSHEGHSGFDNAIFRFSGEVDDPGERGGDAGDHQELRVGPLLLHALRAPLREGEEVPGGGRSRVFGRPVAEEGAMPGLGVRVVVRSAAEKGGRTALLTGSTSTMTKRKKMREKKITGWS